jgi:serine/threonine-protein kinase
MSRSDDAVARLAVSVADGDAIDWSRADADLAHNERRLLRHLRLVESIATLHRSAPAEHTPEFETVSSEPEGPRWGPLVVLERIGEGASSDVFRAWDSGLHRHVALKLIREDGLGASDADVRTLDEGRRLARLRHPNVVDVYGAEKHDGRVGLWMELVLGESLEEIVKTRGPFGAREAAGIGQELCAALAAVHEKNLLHRDIKAQNVVREDGGRIVLMDFGTGEELRRNVGTNRLVGTPLYLAPEVFRGEAASAQSDLYSLGVLLFYLVTAEFPVVAANMPQLAQAHRDRRRRRLRDLRPDLPESFVHAVERALEGDRERRFRTAGEMEAALRESPRPAEEPAPMPAATPSRSWLARYVPFAAVAAATLLAISALVYWIRPRPPVPAAGTAKRIAVLPLAGEAGDSGSAALADTLTVELIGMLGQVSALQVTPLSSVLPFRGSTLSGADISNRLGVEALVQGTVVGDGTSAAGDGTMRAQIRVIAAGRPGVLLERPFTRARGDIERLRAEIARAIADAVDVRLTPDEAARFRRAHQTTPAAEEAYIRGRIQLTAYGPEPARQAAAAFQRAINIDRNYAAAYAGLARAYINLALHGGMSNPDARGSAMQAIRTALDLDEGLADAHAILAEIYFRYDWDWAGAEREYRRSLDLNPSYTYARAYYAQFLAAIRRFDEAYVEATTTRAQDPESSDARTLPAMVQYYRGDFDAAEREARADSLLLARIREAQGRFDEALTITEQAAGKTADSSAVPLRVSLIRRKALSGRSDAAAADLKALERDAANKVIRFTARDQGYVHLALGNVDQALSAFENALDERDPALVWFGVDPRLDDVRSHPRFQAILQRMKMP